MPSAAFVAALALQASCPRAADSLVERGWDRYRAHALPAAQAAFDQARRACGTHPGAQVGLGYVALRADDVPTATRWFETALHANPDDVDALVGLGIVAWRTGDLAAVRERFERVAQLDPSRPEPGEYLPRLPGGVGAAPERPPLVLPDTVEHHVRTRGDYFEIRTQASWRRFYVKGINLGAALPGRHASAFPDSATYAGWLASMGEMGANLVRVYTIHPPHFYGALAAYNRAHPAQPLRLLHGVWAELPPRDDFNDGLWKAAFLADMRRVVDVLHGRADLPLRSGHAAGFYTVDVSRWVLGYIIGREWEPHSVRAFNAANPASTSWTGRYLTITDATPMDAWLVEVCDAMTAYETETYRQQRPIAYTSWPTLDPLHHPTESTTEEEVQLLAALGEYEMEPSKEYDNDAESLDPTRVRATAQFRAGFFAAYHPYPYYPDFMVLDRGYRRARSSRGPSSYFGYLEDLKARHPDMPVVIAEYGVPAGLGIAHFQPQGWHHGGHTEHAMAEIDARMTLEIAEAGMAGGALFAWIDEWFKKNWLVIDYEIPIERNRLWLNRLDPEQHYGVIAMDPGEVLPGRTLAERLEAWREVPALYDTPDGRVRVATDEAHLWVLIEAAAGASERFLGFDIAGPAEGAFRWPGAGAPELPVGVEFVLRATRDDVRVMAAPGANPIQVVGQIIDTVHPASPPVLPPGFVTGRLSMTHPRTFEAPATRDGRFEPLRVITNRRRIARDTTEYLAMGYDRGALRGGGPPDGYWEWDDATGALEVRIPWLLLNVTDPSSGRVLHGHSTRTFPTEVVDAIRITAAARHADGGWIQWPASGAAADAAELALPGWETPRWQARRRPVFEAMRHAFATLTPVRGALR